MDSWRLIFIDIDQSFNIPVADSAIQGYMVVRAPKGSTEAVYFPKGSTNQIHAMLGIPTADWPDIQDALDLNGSYGIWISAPPGTSAAYPSYFGGVYLTKQGPFPFYQVSDRNNPNFQALLNPEREDTEYVHSGRPSSLVQPIDRANNLSGKDKIQITGVPAEVLSSVIGINFNFWGNNQAPSAVQGAKAYQLVIKGNSIQIEDPSNPGTMIPVGTVNGDMVEITGTGSSGLSSFMYLDFEQLISSEPYKTTSGEWKSTTDQTTYGTLLHQEILNSIQWIADVRDITYMTIAQKTPTEKETFVTISDIGYDKYYYDLALDAYENEAFSAWTQYPQYPRPEDAENADGLFVYFLTESNTTLLKTGIYQSTGPRTPPKDVTKDYRNKYIRIANAGIRHNADGSLMVPPRDTIDAGSHIDEIYFVNAVGQLILCQTVIAPHGTQNPRMAVNYNQVTFSVVEDVYPGDQTSGGTHTGSLSETGTDSYGGNIYFPNVIPENALSYVDVAVYKTFDTDINGAGFFDGYRIIDAMGRIFDTTTTGITDQQLISSITTGRLGAPSMQGQRFVTNLVNGLIGAGKTGGTLDPEFDFTTTVTAGWVEAGKGMYEPIPVFAEPTGIESLKEIMFNLRRSTHKVATFVSPRLINESDANDPSSIIVSARSTGTAQIVNQALRADTFTGAKYWTNLIGAYAAQLLYIIDGKLGGWAPMWTNIAGYGGQLPITVSKMQHEFSQEQLRVLDEIGLNPVTLDPTYGLMVTSQKTTQDPDNLSDWSYLGHSMAFDLFKREVRDNVMVPQIGKPNDSYYQQMRQRQVEALLNRRTGGAEPIWAAGKVEIANVNTDDVKAQRKFAIRVSVKVNVFSELVELTFVNVAQTTQI